MGCRVVLWKGGGKIRLCLLDVERAEGKPLIGFCALVGLESNATAKQSRQSSSPRPANWFHEPEF